MPINEYENFFKPSEKFVDLFLAHCRNHTPPTTSILDPEEIRSRIRKLLLRRLGLLWRELKRDSRYLFPIIKGNEFVVEISSKITENMPQPVNDAREQNERQELLVLLAKEFRAWVKNESKKYPEYVFLSVDEKGDVYMNLISLRD